MSLRRQDVFTPLDPPPGGVALLRERLAGRRRSRAWLLAIPAAACAVVLVVALRPAPADFFGARLANDPAAQMLGLVPHGHTIAGAVEGREGTAVLAVATGNPNVVMYWIDVSGD
jgi:hypothetical protein